MRKGEVILNGHVPPHSEEAEINIISSLLIYPQFMIDVMETLDPDDFFDQFHKEVYQSCLNLHDKGVVPDIIALYEDNRELDMARLTKMNIDVPNYAMNGSALWVKIKLIKEFSIRRQTIALFQKSISSMYDYTMDCMDEVVTADAELTKMLSFLNWKHISTLGQVMSETIHQVEQEQSGESKALRLDTGIPALDIVLKGIFPPDFIIICGSGSEGKSSLSLQIGKNIAFNGNPVGYVSLEMENKQLGWKIISSDIEVEVSNIREGRLSEEQMQGVASLGSKYYDTKLYFYENFGMSIIDFSAAARKMVAKYGVKIIILDYIQLLSTEGVKQKLATTKDQVSYISRTIKQLCKELSIPIIGLSQFSRRERGVKRFHALSDLKDSSSLETDSDGVLAICRPFVHGITEMDGYNNGNSFEENDAVIQMLKWRLGHKQDVMLKFNGAFNRFEEIDKTPFKQLEITDWNIYKRPKEIEFIDDAEIDSNLPVPF